MSQVSDMLIMPTHASMVPAHGTVSCKGRLPLITVIHIMKIIFRILLHLMMLF